MVSSTMEMRIWNYWWTWASAGVGKTGICPPGNWA